MARGMSRLLGVEAAGAMTRASYVALAIAILLVVGTGVVVLRGAPATAGSADEMVDRWVQALAEPSGDRGWSLLSPEAQLSVYSGDPERYWADLGTVEWSSVVWAPAFGYVDDGRFYSGSVSLLSHPSTLPGVLVERGLVGSFCIDDLPYGIHVRMLVGWFTPPRIEASAQAGSADPCAEAFDDDPGPPHELFDLVGGAWGSPGPNQRVGVLDRTGLVAMVGVGRENPPAPDPVSVSNFEPRQLAITWRGARCDSNTTLIVGGTASDLEIVIDRGVEGACAGIDVTYEAMLELRQDVPAEGVDAHLAPERG